MKIIGVATVKNESDIIESFIRHNLFFIDRFVVLNNNSSDSTGKILENLKLEGLPIEVILDIDNTHNQSYKITNIIKKLTQGEKFDFIIPLDADEFILADNRNIFENALLDLKEQDCGLLPWRTYVPTPHDDWHEVDPLRRIVHRRAIEPDQFLFYKVVIPYNVAALCGFFVHEGNHSVSFKSRMQVKHIALKEIYLAHIPVRSPDQILSKIIIGEWTLKTKPNRKPGEAYQWTQLYEHFIQNLTINYEDLQRIAEYYAISSQIPESIKIVFDPIKLQPRYRITQQKFIDTNLLRRVIEHAKLFFERNFVIKNEKKKKYGNVGLYGKDREYYSAINNTLLSMIESNSYPLRILDIGCGDGANGLIIKQKFPCEYMGIEINREAALIAETKLDRVIIGNIEEINLKDYGIVEKSFDYIIYGDILEHLYDPWTLLNEYKDFLKDDGYIVASIPNVRNLEIISSLVDGNWTYKESGILDSTHLRFFTFGEIKKMFTSCKLQIVDVKHNIQKFFDINKIQGYTNIELKKLTVKNVSKDESLELSTVQFIVKAKKEAILKTDATNSSEKIHQAIPQTSKQLPIVSICIPTYNGEKFLSDALSSVFFQTYQNIEIILSDDGSTDKTLEIAALFKGKTSKEFIIISHPNYGLVPNWNFCIRHAKGKYIKFLHQDDVLESDCITELINIAERDNDIGLVFSARGVLISADAEKDPSCMSDQYIRDLHKSWTELQTIQSGYKLLEDPNLFNCPINKFGEPTTVLIKKEVFENIGGFDEDLCQLVDVEMWLRIMSQYKIGFSEKVLSHFRIHPEQQTRRNARERQTMTADWQKFYDKIAKDSRYPENMRQEASRRLTDIKQQSDMNLRSERKHLSESWLRVPPEFLEKAYSGDMGNAHRRLMESGIRNEALSNEETAFFQHFNSELNRRSSVDPVSAMNYLLVIMLYLPSGRLKIENAKASLPGWLIGDYERFFGV